MKQQTRFSLGAAILFWLLFVSISCKPQATDRCTDKYYSIIRLLRTPVTAVDSSSLNQLYLLVKDELSCDTISPLTIRAAYRCLAYHGYHAKALNLALDSRFLRRRSLLDTLNIACLYLRLGDTVSAKEIVELAMVKGDVTINVNEATDFGGTTRTSIFGLILAQQLGFHVDEAKISLFRNSIPLEARGEFDTIVEKLDFTIATLVPDKQIDSDK
jgi:hypothetical protein